VKEFLDSTAQGEVFRVWIYDEDDSPGTYLDLKRTNSGYAYTRHLTGRTRDEDLYTVSFSGIEVD
jgi:hypothetical protein